MEAQVIANAAPATAVEIYNRSLDQFNDGAAILYRNQETVDKAKAAGQHLLNAIQAAGGVLTPDLDQRCNDFMAKITRRLKELMEARKPVTQMMDMVKSLFTALERELDGKVAGTIPAIIQDYRNTYARQVAEEAKRKQEEAAREAAKGREAVEIKAMFERMLLDHFALHLGKVKDSVAAAFNAITLANFEQKEKDLNNYNPAYPYDHFTSFQPTAPINRFHNTEELQLILTNVTAGRFDALADRFKTELGDLKRQLVDRLPSKRTELEQMAAAGEAERQRLEDQKRQREEAEEQRRKDDAEAQRQKDEAAIAASKAGAETMVMFNQEAAISETTPAPETRQGYEITVTHQAGFVEIFTFWFQNEGKNLSIDKLGNTKLDQMKAWAEKHAHKTGEKIESRFLSYEPSYKAVNRKSA